MCELRSGRGVAEARPGDGSDRPGAQVRERDVLLATKLRVPRDVWGLDLTEQRVALLEERTKGWVTGRSDGQQLLEDLERANLFLVALDGQRRWYRYHRLFADLLRVRQRQEGGAERVAGLHRRAAAWSAGRGLVDDAVRHAMAAG